MTRRGTPPICVVVAYALAMLAALGAPGTARAQQLFGPSQLAADGGVIWRAEPVTRSVVADSAHALLARARSVTDSIRAWRALAGDSALRVFALRRIAPALLAAGDSLGADSAWASVSAARSIWTYEALRGRADLALLRGDPEGAEDLLDRADREGWPDLDRVSWLVRRSELRAMLGDVTQAIEFAQQAIRRLRAVLRQSQGEPFGGSRDPKAIGQCRRADPPQHC